MFSMIEFGLAAAGALNNHPSMRTQNILLAIALSLTVPAWVSAQSQITTAVIEGVVTDSSGAVLPGVTVELRNVDTNFTRTLVTDRDGRFVGLQLPPGRSPVPYKLPGFATLVQAHAPVTPPHSPRLTPLPIL